MSIKHIIVTTEHFHSEDRYDIISSNIEYVTKLFQNNLREDKISEEALKSYYVDYYLSHILHGGFGEFIENFKKRDIALYYIRSGLEALNAENHLSLFNKIFSEKHESKTLSNFDSEFREIEKYENLINLNHHWLKSHKMLLIINPYYINKKIQIHVNEHRKDRRHIKIIKQLCNIIGEDFISITAGDKNNIFIKSWFFKTTKNHYYTIEKKNIVTLYNSFTKKEVAKSRIISNKPQKSIVSEFISKMLA